MNASARSFVVAIGATLVVGLAFVATNALLPDPTRPTRDREKATTVDLPPVGNALEGEGVGPGEGVRLRLFDPKTNEPAAQVQVGRYRRTSEEEAAVEDVVITLLVRGGAAATIRSPRGTLRVGRPPAGRQADVATDTLAAADALRLDDVELAWFTVADELAAGRPPSATVTLPNALVDRSKLTLQTIDSVVAGGTRLGDEQPVKLRGVDYDLDAEGLLVEWDADAGRPGLVRLARATRLVLKNPPEFLPRGVLPGDDRPTQEATAKVATYDLLASMELAGEPADRPSRDASFTPFRVTIDGPLVAEQAGQTLLSGRDAVALLPLAEQPKESAELPTPAPRADPPADVAPATTATPPPTTPTTSTPAFQPIIVRLNGEVRIQPATDATLESSADAAFSLAGSPLQAELGGQIITAGSLDYAKAQDRLVLQAAGDGAVTIRDAEGARLVAPRFVAAPEAGTATALGVGSATLPGDEEPTTLRWVDACEFAFSDAGGLETLHARGDVRASGVAFDLDCDDLHISLEDDEVRRLVAAGTVVAQFEDEKPTTLATSRLVVDLPLGIDGPTDLSASGGVRVDRGDGSSLNGKQLRAKLVDGVLEQLRVEHDVRLQDADGRQAEATIVTTRGTDGPLVLTGTEDRPAVVRAPQGESGQMVNVSSQTLVLNAADGSLASPGSGMLSAEDDEGGYEVRWTKAMAATERRIDLSGSVVAEGRDVRAMAAKVTIHLAADAPADDAAAAVERVLLTDDVRLDAAVNFRRVALRAEQAIAFPATGAAEVPVPGRALVEDLRPDDDGDGFRGTAAFAWEKRLDYDGTFAAMIGGVTIVLRPRDGIEVTVKAAEVSAETTRADDAVALAAAATGDVRIETVDLLIEAERVQFDAARNLLIASATETSSVRLFDGSGRSRGSFSSIEYDVAAGQVVRLVDLRGQ